MSENNQTPAEGKDYQVLYMTACQILGVSEEGFETALKENAELAEAAKKLGEKKLAAQTAKADKEAATDAAKKAKADRVAEKNAEKLRRWKRAAPLRMVSGGVRMVIWNILAALSPILFVGGGIAFVFLILPLILQNQNLLKKAEQGTGQIAQQGQEILGSQFRPEDDKLEDVLKRAQQWEARYNEEHGNWTASQESLQQMQTDRDRWRQQAEENTGTIGTNMLEIQRLRDELQRANSGTESWRQESQSSRDLMYAARRNETRARAELVRVATQGWLCFKIAAHYRYEGFRAFGPTERRDLFAQNVNVLLAVICDQMERGAAEPEERRFWEHTCKNDDNTGQLCRDVVGQEVLVMRQNRFPFAAGLEARLRTARLLID